MATREEFEWVESWLQATGKTEAELCAAALGNAKALDEVRAGTAPDGTMSTLVRYINANMPWKR